MSSSHSPLARLFLAIEGVSRRNHRVVILLAILTFVGAAALSLTLHFQTDILELLPQKEPAVRSFRETVKTFGALDPFPVVVVAAEGYEAEDYEEWADALATRLRADKTISSVETGLDTDSPLIRHVQERLPLFLGEAELADLRTRLSDAGIQASVADARRLLEVVPSPEFREFIRRDPLRLSTILLAKLTGARGGGSGMGGSGRIVSKDGQALMIIVRPIKPAQDVASSKDLVARVDAALAATHVEMARVDAELPEPKILKGGRYAISVEDSNLILSDIGRTMRFSFFGVVFLYLFCYRRLGAVAYSVVPLLVGQCLTFALARLAFGSLNSATATSAALLMGLGTDFTIVMYARYVEERRAGKSLDEASRVMMGETALGVYTGALTSAGTFGALLLTSFVGLKQFGLLVGSGILLCLVSILVMLPALVIALESRYEGATGRSLLRIEAVVNFVGKHPRTSALIWSAVICIGFRLHFWPDDIAAMLFGSRVGGDVTTETFAWSVTAIALLGLGIALLAAGIFMAAHRHASGRLYVHSFGFERLIPISRRHPRIVVALCLVVSAIALPLALRLKLNESVEDLRSSENRGIRDQEEIKQLFGTDPNAVMIVTRGSDPADVDARSRRLEGKLEEFRAAGRLTRVDGLGAVLPSAAAQDGVRAALLAGASDFDPDRIEATLRQALRDNGLNEAGFGEAIATLRQSLRPEGNVTEADLAAHGGAELVARYVREGPETARVTYAYGPVDEAMVAEIHAVDSAASVAGVNLLSRSLKKVLRRDVATCLGVGIVIVAILLALDFGSWLLSALALAQLLVGLLWMLGAMSLFNVPLTMINAFAAALLMGVGIDYGIHILHRLAGPDAGTESAVAETGKAVAMAAMTNVVGFGALLLSNYPGLRGLGKAAMMGSVGCLITSLTLLPALAVLTTRRSR